MFSSPRSHSGFAHQSVNLLLLSSSYPHIIKMAKLAVALALVALFAVAYGQILGGAGLGLGVGRVGGLGLGGWGGLGSRGWGIGGISATQRLQGWGWGGWGQGGIGGVGIGGIGLGGVGLGLGGAGIIG